MPSKRFVISRMRPYFTALFALFAVGVVLLAASFLPHATYSDDDPAYNRVYWEAEIGARGAHAAYQEFTEKNGAAPLSRRHFAAHVIGALLYRMEGTRGFSVCTPDFGFGCYHGFFSSAVAEGGEDAIAVLDAACVDAYGTLGAGCQHGIGHGALEYLGYDRISDALALCSSKTTQPAPLLGCTSGVFMEYFSPLAGSADGVMPEARPVSAENPYLPCRDVPERYRASCYYELGAHFHISLRDESFALCGGLTGDARMYCFLGAGSDVPRLNGDAAASRAVCNELSADDAFACRAGAAWAFISAAAGEADPGNLCAYNDEKLARRCKTLADLTEGRDARLQEMFK